MKVRWPRVPIFNEVKMDKWLYKLVLYYESEVA